MSERDPFQIGAVHFGPGGAVRLTDEELSRAVSSMPSSSDPGIQRFTVVYTGPDGKKREQIFDVPLPENERFIRPRVTFSDNGEPATVEAVPAWTPSALTVTGLDPVPPPEPEGWSIVREEPASGGAPVWYVVGPQRESREEAAIDLPEIAPWTTEMEAGAVAERALWLKVIGGFLADVGERMHPDATAILNSVVRRVDELTPATMGESVPIPRRPERSQ